MTTKQAALLAAVGQTLNFFAVSILPFSYLVTLGPRHALFLRLLPTFLLSVISFAALPAFFVCVYLNEPPLVISERLRRPALVVAIATGLSAAMVAFVQIRVFISSWDRYGNPLMRADHPLQWLWEWPLRFLISIFAAVVVPIFFFTVSRSRAELSGANPRLKKAAMYAGVVTIVGAAYTIYGYVVNEFFYSTHQAALAAQGMTPGTGLWHRTLGTLLSLFYSGLLAWFFFVFYKTVPTTQSSQRLSSGE
jgi:hypothetical protein